MQQYKIDNYLKLTTNSTFPKYTILSDIGCSSIIDSIDNLLQVAERSDNVFVMISEYCASESFEQDELNSLKSVLDKIGFSCDEEVYLVWDENEIDKMKTTMLLKHWSDIWYPPSDEAVILYCATKDKFLMIHHADIVYYN